MYGAYVGTGVGSGGLMFAGLHTGSVVMMTLSAVMAAVTAVAVARRVRRREANERP